MFKFHKMVILSFIFVFLGISCGMPKDKQKKQKNTKTKVVKNKNQRLSKKQNKKTNIFKVKPRKIMAVLNLSGSFKETSSSSPFSNQATPFYKLLSALKKIHINKNIAGILIHLKQPKMSIELMWELRLMLERIKQSGKKLIIYSDTFNTTDYYLASIADVVGLNPAGSWEVFGFMIETVFLKDFLDFLGMKADFIHIGKYKSAAENVTRNEMSPEFKKSLNDLLDAFYNELVAGISKSRKIDKKTLDKLISSAPLTANDALKNKLVDVVAPYSGKAFFDKFTSGYQIKIIGKKKKKKQSLLQLLSSGYVTPEYSDDHIALIIADGSIIYGSKDKNDAFSDKSVIASSSFIKVLKKVRKNKYIRGVVIRVNSPGGSALASEIIWNEVKRLSKVKPVYISMGLFAASGGYYISSAANKIFVSPFTITGSIGVIGGKIVFENILKKLKIHPQRLTRGANAGLYSGVSQFSTTERKAILKSMTTTYDLFKQRVFSGRKDKIKNLEELEKIAQGRIWMGNQALANGLADATGTLYQVVKNLKTHLRLPHKTPVILYPRPKPWLVELSELMESGTDFDDVIVSKVFAKTTMPLFDNVYSFYSMLKQEHTFAFLPILISIK